MFIFLLLIAVCSRTTLLNIWYLANFVFWIHLLGSCFSNGCSTLGLKILDLSRYMFGSYFQLGQSELIIRLVFTDVSGMFNWLKQSRDIFVLTRCKSCLLAHPPPHPKDIKSPAYTGPHAPDTTTGAPYHPGAINRDPSRPPTARLDTLTTVPEFKRAPPTL